MFDTPLSPLSSCFKFMFLVLLFYYSCAACMKICILHFEACLRGCSKLDSKLRYMRISIVKRGTIVVQWGRKMLFSRLALEKGHSDCSNEETGRSHS
jgi:hypothetical protein